MSQTDTRPRLRKSVDIVSRDDGTVVLVDELTGELMEVEADLAPVVSQLDGSHTISSLVSSVVQKTQGTVNARTLHGFFSALGAHGLLEGSASIRRGFWGRVWWMFPLKGWWADLLLMVPPLVLVVALRGLFDPRDKSPFALLPGGRTDAGLLGSLMGIWLALSVRALVHALGAGRETRQVGLVWRGVLLFEATPPGWLFGSKYRRVFVHAFCLVALGALAGLLALQSGTVFHSASVGVTLVFFFETCPFVLSSVGRLLAAASGRVDLREHVRAYLSRRFLSRFRQKAFEGEGLLVIMATLSTVWAVVGLEVMSRWAPHEITGLFTAISLTTGPDWYAGIIGIAAITIITLASVVLTAVVGWIALRSALPSRLKPATASIQPLLEARADAKTVLRQVPLFARLEEGAIEALATEVKQVTYKPGGVIVRQNDPADAFYALLSGRAQVLFEEASGKRDLLATLMAGDCFGEVALLNASPRTATVKAETEVVALALSRAGFDKLATAYSGTDFTQRIRTVATLQKNPILRGLSPELMSLLASRLQPQSFRPGEYVLRRGEEGDCLYVVVQGQFEVMDAHDSKPIAQLGEGDYFGELAILHAVTRTASVRAVGPSSVFRLSREDFFDILARDLALLAHVEQTAEARVRSVA